MHPEGETGKRPRVVRFDHFVFDATTGELWQDNATNTVLRPQLAMLLHLLLNSHGQLVTRAEIQHRLWGDKVLDVDRSINFCVRQLREVLGDEAREPRFVETLPRQGYRFLVPVEEVTGQWLEGQHGGSRFSPKSPDSSPERPPRPLLRPRRFTRGMVLVLMVLSFIGVWGSSNTPSRTEPPSTPVPAAELGVAEEPGVAGPAEHAFLRGEEQLLEGLFDKAVASFQEVIIYDPSHAKAWGQLCQAHLQLAMDEPEHFIKAQVAYERLRELAPDLALTEVRSGDLLAMRDRDWWGAIAAYRKVVQREPEHMEAHMSLGMVLPLVGRWEEAMMHSMRAVEIDPVSLLALGHAMNTHAAAGCWVEVETLARRAQELRDRPGGSLAIQIQALLHLGHIEEAKEVALILMPRIRLKEETIPLETLEDFDIIWEQLAEVILKGPGHSRRANRALFLAELGHRHAHHREAALRELEELASSGTAFLPFILRDPRFASVSEDPRFLAVLRSAGLEPHPFQTRILGKAEGDPSRGEIPVRERL